MWSESIRIWGKAINFYIANLFLFIPVLPLVFIPFLGNIFLSVLIKQKIHDEKIAIFTAIKESWNYVATFIYLSFSFAFLPAITEGVPVLGDYLDVKYSRYIAMLPNVMVFEGLTGKSECRERCQTLVHNQGIAIRTTYTIPVLLGIVYLIFWVSYVTAFEPSHPILLFVIPLFFFMPISGAVNTFLYLMLDEKSIIGND